MAVGDRPLTWYATENGDQGSFVELIDLVRHSPKVALRQSIGRLVQAPWLIDMRAEVVGVPAPEAGREEETMIVAEYAVLLVVECSHC